MNQVIQNYESRVDQLLERLDFASEQKNHIQVIEIEKEIERLLMELEVELEMDIIQLRTVH